MKTTLINKPWGTRERNQRKLLEKYSRKLVQIIRKNTQGNNGKILNKSAQNT